MAGSLFLKTIMEDTERLCIPRMSRRVLLGFSSTLCCTWKRVSTVVSWNSSFSWFEKSNETNIILLFCKREDFQFRGWQKHFLQLCMLEKWTYFSVSFQTFLARLTADTGLEQAGIFLLGYTLAESHYGFSSHTHNHPALQPGKVRWPIYVCVGFSGKQKGKCFLVTRINSKNVSAKDWGILLWLMITFCMRWLDTVPDNLLNSFCLLGRVQSFLEN